MKMGREDRAAAERMGPGATTGPGFLGHDSRALSDIIEADEEAARAIGLDFGEAAALLERLAEAAWAGMGEENEVEGKWIVRSDEARGKLPCPWRDGLYHKGVARARLVDSDEELAFSELSAHLLREHHFCQGEGSPFRLDPAALKRVLRL